MNYQLVLNTQVIMGRGASKDAGKIAKEQFGAKRVFCLYDTGIAALGLADPMVEAMKAEGLDVVIFDKVVSDPPIPMVEEAGRLAREEGCDVIVALGGGSTLDTAKSVNVMVGNPDSNLTDFIGFEPPMNPGKPTIMIPTTSGTGAEVSPVSVISTPEGEKLAIFSTTGCLPTVALVDPELLVGLPASLTASTGFDSLAHAIEAYTSKVENPLSDSFATEAIYLIGKYLPEAVHNGKNLDAREAMCNACTLAALAMNHTLLHLGHSIGTPFGGRFHIQHGAACGLFLPGVVEFIAPACPEKTKIIADRLGVKDTDGLTPEELGAKLADWMRDFMNDIQFPTMQSLGITEDDFDVIADDTLVDLNIGNCPREVTKEAVLDILKAEYEKR